MGSGRALLKNTGALGFSNILTVISRTVLVLAISRLASVEGLGVYSTAMAFYYIASMWGTMGMINFLSREIAKYPEQTNRYFIHASLLTAIAALGMVGGLNSLPWIVTYSPQARLAIRLVSLAIVPGTLTIVLQAVFLAHQRLEYFAMVSLVEAVGHITLSAFLLWKKAGALGVIASFAFFRYFTVLTLGFLMTRLISRLRWEWDPAFLRSLLRGLRTFAALGVLGALFARPEVLLLSSLRGDKEIGLYSAALWLVTLWYLIPSSYTTALFPQLARSYHQGQLQTIRFLQERSVKYLEAIAWPLAVGIAVMADEIIQIVFGARFTPAATALRLMSIVLVLNFLTRILSRILFARDEQGLVLRVQNISLVARLSLGGILIYIWGYLGAAITLVLSNIIMASLLLMYVYRGGTRLRIIHHTWRLVVASTGMGVLIAGLRPLLTVYWLVPIAILAYTVLVGLLGGISREELAFLYRAWRPATSS